MIHVTIDELVELKTSISTLRQVLETLDTIGAGIAAIHVDAAISQLCDNVEVIESTTAAISKNASNCAGEHPTSLG